MARELSATPTRGFMDVNSKSRSWARWHCRRCPTYVSWVIYGAGHLASLPQVLSIPACTGHQRQCFSPMGFPSS